MFGLWSKIGFLVHGRDIDWLVERKLDLIGKESHVVHCIPTKGVLVAQRNIEMISPFPFLLACYSFHYDLHLSV